MSERQPTRTEPPQEADDDIVDLCARTRRAADPRKKRLILARIDALLSARRPAKSPDQAGR